MKTDLRTMRTLLIALFLAFTSNGTLSANESNPTDSILGLKREVLELFERHRSDFPEIQDQEVTVSFLINAKNELIILDVEGENNTTCDLVRKVLSYKKVKYNPGKQLTSYKLKVHLTKGKGEGFGCEIKV